MRTSVSGGWSTRDAFLGSERLIAVPACAGADRSRKITRRWDILLMFKTAEAQAQGGERWLRKK